MTPHELSTQPEYMRILRYCFPTFVQFFFWLRERLTLGGAAIFVALLLCTPAIVQSETSLVHLFSALAALLLVTFGLSYCFRPRLQVKSKMEVRCMRGEHFEIDFWITNLSNWPAYELQIELLDPPESWQICDGWPNFDTLPAGATVHCTLKIRTTQRGRFPMPAICVITTFPLHLIRRIHKFASTGQIYVHPRYAQHPTLEILEDCHGTVGLERETAQLSRGSTEYIGNREYQAGVPVRRWDYASWARLGRPIVREYLEVQPASAMILVDLANANGTTATPIAEVEAALEIAASLAQSLLQRGWAIQPMLLGSQLLHAPSQTNSLDLDTVLDALAEAQPMPESRFADFAQQAKAASQSESVHFVIFNRWNDSRRAVCDAWQAAGCDWRGWIIAHSPEQRLPREFYSSLNAIPLQEFEDTGTQAAQAKGGNP
jgi:uncharacterized protein (DUF58 family)